MQCSAVDGKQKHSFDLGVSPTPSVGIRRSLKRHRIGSRRQLAFYSKSQWLKPYNMDWQKNADAANNCSSGLSQSKAESHSQNKRQQNDRTCTVFLTEDIILFNILTRLPAAFLLESARLVCKAWAAAICKSQFVEAHLLHSKSGVFLQSTRQPFGARFLEIKDNGEYKITHLKSSYPGRILNSCEGVSLFLQYATGALHVYNPVTKQEERIPDLLGDQLIYPPCAIVRVPQSGEFKVFAANVEKQSGVSVCHWYVLRLGIDNAWREICTESGDFDFKCTPILTGGYDLYWVTEHRVIVTDVAKETFQAFQLPQELQWHPQYLKMGDCLSSIVFFEQGFQVFIFDRKSGQWTSYHQIGHLNYPAGYEVLSEFFCVWINEEVIIKPTLAPSLRSVIFGYNMKTRNLRIVNAIEMGSYDLALHSDSLVTWKRALP